MSLNKIRLQMDEGEIIRNYKASKNPFQQVSVLADLNVVSKKEMAVWLRDHGCEVDRRYFGVARKNKDAGEDTVRNADEARGVPDITVREQEVGNVPDISAAEPGREEKNRAESRRTEEGLTRVKIYIAGLITGNPDYMEEFQAVEKWLTENGFCPVNPAHNTAENYKGYIDAGMRQLMTCDMICMIPGWMDSDGATFEKSYAELTEIPELLIPRGTWNRIEQNIRRKHTGTVKSQETASEELSAEEQHDRLLKYLAQNARMSADDRK